jgi:hypothetical protein
MVFAGVKVVSIGRVVSARTQGMGIVFTRVEQRYQAILERWIRPHVSGVRCLGTEHPPPALHALCEAANLGERV